MSTSNEQTLKRLRALCLSLPETSEASSWGHPNFRAGKKTFVAFERVKGRPSIAWGCVPQVRYRTAYFVRGSDNYVGPAISRQRSRKYASTNQGSR